MREAAYVSGGQFKVPRLFHLVRVSDEISLLGKTRRRNTGKKEAQEQGCANAYGRKGHEREILELSGDFENEIEFHFQNHMISQAAGTAPVSFHQAECKSGWTAQSLR